MNDIICLHHNDAARSKMQCPICLELELAKARQTIESQSETLKELLSASQELMATVSDANRLMQNLTAVMTTGKTENAGSVVPEAGIEPATKGL